MDGPDINRPKKRVKYSKLSKEQRLEIIKYWNDFQLPISSITEKFSTEWKIPLSQRGVADIISFWKEKGRVRGSLHEESVHSDIVNEVVSVTSWCEDRSIPLSSKFLIAMITNIASRMDCCIEKYEMAYLENVCNDITKRQQQRIASKIDIIKKNMDDELLAYDSAVMSYSADTIFCLDSLLFCPHVMTSSLDCLSLWYIVCKDGPSPMNPWIILPPSSSLLQQPPLVDSANTCEIRSSHTSVASVLAEYLVSLDRIVQKSSLLFFVDYGELLELSSSPEYDIVKIHDTDKSDNSGDISISLSYIHIYIISPLAAIRCLPTHRGVQWLFRLILKTQFLQWSLNNLDINYGMICTNAWNQLTKCDINQFWGGLNSSTIPQIPSNFDEESTEIASYYVYFVNQFIKIYHQYIRNSQVSELRLISANDYVTVEESPQFMGIKCIHSILHKPNYAETIGCNITTINIQESGNSVDISDHDSQSPLRERYVDGNEQQSLIDTFFDTYRDILLSLTDLSQEDIEKMDSLKRILMKSHPIMSL